MEGRGLEKALSVHVRQLGVSQKSESELEQSVVTGTLIFRRQIEDTDHLRKRIASLSGKILTHQSELDCS